MQHPSSVATDKTHPRFVTFRTGTVVAAGLTEVLLELDQTRSRSRGTRVLCPYLREHG